MPDPVLENLMTGAGSIKFQNSTGRIDQAVAGISLPGYVQPSLFAFDPANPNQIVAGGVDSGVFLSTDAGTSWRLLTDPFDAGGSGIPNLPRPRFAYFDNEPAGTTNVYIGTVGRGVWRIGIDGTAFDLTADRFEQNDTSALRRCWDRCKRSPERSHDP